MGGLGNQMYQYALGRRLSLDRGVPLKLDLSWYSNQNIRSYGLDQFNIQASIASEDEINRIISYSNHSLVRKIFSVYQHVLPYWKRRKIKEKNHLKYDYRILSAPRNCWVNGYWHNAEYFLSIASVIKKDFTLRTELSGKTQKVINSIKTTVNSISVHVRRGDYAQGTKLFDALPLEYYMSAVNYIASKRSDPHFFFFSDDIDWVRKNLIIDHPATYIDPTTNDAVDLIIMTHCNDHINANSSFSWWSAWLGEKDDGITIVPKNWYKSLPFPEDRMPKHWLRL